MYKVRNNKGEKKMYKVIISSLNDKIRFTSYVCKNELEAIQEYNRECNILQRNANINRMVDQKILLVFEVSTIREFIPSIQVYL